MIDTLGSFLDLVELEVIGFAEAKGRLFDRLDGVRMGVDVGFQRLVFLQKMLHRRQISSVILRLQLQLHIVHPVVDVVHIATKEKRLIIPINN